MLIVSKALLISSATVIVRAGGTIWLDPFATVYFNVCSAVTVLCLVAVMRGCVCCYVRNKAILQIFAITERRDMGLYEVPLFMSLLGYGLWNIVANLHMCGIILVLRAVFNMLVRNASPRGPM